LLAPVAASAVLLTVAAALALRRDIGTGLLPARDSAPARLRLLRSPTAQALRSERSTLSVWLASVTAFALILGVISASISAAGISKQIQQELAKLGEGSILTPTGYVSFVFLFFVLALSLFSCAQVGAARHEEADQQLETLFAEPVGRSQWLGGRLALAAAGAAAISLCAGVATWLGATAAGVHVSFAQLLEAGANCLPVALLFLGVAALAYAFAPRAGGGIAYALVTLTFLWQLVGSLLGSPSWLLDLSPFAHVGLVPAQPFRSSAALAMIGIGVATALAAIWRFRRRDLLGA
jgi:ABC-2 type transport system permease protein